MSIHPELGIRVIMAGNMGFSLHMKVSAGTWGCRCPSPSVQPGSPTAASETSFHRDSDSLPADVTHWKPISRGYYWMLIRDSPNFCFRKTRPIALSSVMFKENRHSAEGWQHSRRTAQCMALGWGQSSAKWTSPLALEDTLFKVTQLLLMGYFYYGKAFPKK